MSTSRRARDVDVGHDVLMLPAAVYTMKPTPSENQRYWQQQKGPSHKTDTSFLGWLTSSHCWSLRNSVIVLGLLSIFVHILEFFAYVYLATAFLLIRYEKLPKSSNVLWTYGYPGGLILHSGIQVAMSILLIIGAVTRKKSYMLPWIITTVVECLSLCGSSIYLVSHLEPATAWIVATTVAFFSVQVFYVVVVIVLYRRLKQEEKEIQPPEYQQHF